MYIRLKYYHILLLFKNSFLETTVRKNKILDKNLIDWGDEALKKKTGTRRKIPGNLGKIPFSVDPRLRWVRQAASPGPEPRTPDPNPGLEPQCLRLPCETINHPFSGQWLIPPSTEGGSPGRWNVISMLVNYLPTKMNSKITQRLGMSSVEFTTFQLFKKVGDLVKNNVL